MVIFMLLYCRTTLLLTVCKYSHAGDKIQCTLFFYMNCIVFCIHNMNVEFHLTYSMWFILVVIEQKKFNSTLSV